MFDSWVKELLDKEKDEGKRAILKTQFDRFYQPHDPMSQVIVGVTTNPPLTKGAIDLGRKTWDGWADDFIKSHPRASEKDIFWAVYAEVVKRGALRIKPIFEASNYRLGYICGQVDPRHLTDTDEMVRQGEFLNRTSPNVMVKMPGTKEGIDGIRILTSKGIPTNTTVCFSVAQLTAVAKAALKGLEEAEAKGT